VASFVVPFRADMARRRLAPLPAVERERLALAMLADVLTACVSAGETVLAGDAAAALELAVGLGAKAVADAGGSHSGAVRSGLEAFGGGPVVIVNADLPCVQARDLLALVGATPPDGLALVRARDGGTNALSLATPSLFAPLYGPASAERFFRHAAAAGVQAALAEIPGLADDARSPADLHRLGERLGARTRAALGVHDARVA
jgi:2-phospho-L-lactate guanylyltransferase